jgi:hypothetical protein
MRVKHLLTQFGRLSLCGLAGWALAFPLSVQATNTNVKVSDGANTLAFTPNAVTINTVNFLDNSATGAVNFYRVHLLPNP